MFKEVLHKLLDAAATVAPDLSYSCFKLLWSELGIPLMWMPPTDSDVSNAGHLEDWQQVEKDKLRNDMIWLVDQLFMYAHIGERDSVTVSRVSRPPEKQSVYALFALYTLHQTQPFRPRVRIPLSQRYWSALATLASLFASTSETLHAAHVLAKMQDKASSNSVGPAVASTTNNTTKRSVSTITPSEPDNIDGAWEFVLESSHQHRQMKRRTLLAEKEEDMEAVPSEEQRIREEQHHKHNFIHETEVIAMREKQMLSEDTLPQREVEDEQLAALDLSSYTLDHLRLPIEQVVPLMDAMSKAEVYKRRFDAVQRAMQGRSSINPASIGAKSRSRHPPTSSSSITIDYSPLPSANLPRLSTTFLRPVSKDPNVPNLFRALLPLVPQQQQQQRPTLPTSADIASSPAAADQNTIAPPTSSDSFLTQLKTLLEPSDRVPSFTPASGSAASTSTHLHDESADVVDEDDEEQQNDDDEYDDYDDIDDESEPDERPLSLEELISSFDTAAAAPLNEPDSESLNPRLDVARQQSLLSSLQADEDTMTTKTAVVYRTSTSDPIEHPSPLLTHDQFSDAIQREREEYGTQNVSDRTNFHPHSANEPVVLASHRDRHVELHGEGIAQRTAREAFVSQGSRVVQPQTRPSLVIPPLLHPRSDQLYVLKRKLARMREVNHPSNSQAGRNRTANEGESGLAQDVAGALSRIHSSYLSQVPHSSSIDINDANSVVDQHDEAEHRRTHALVRSDTIFSTSTAFAYAAAATWSSHEVRAVRQSTHHVGPDLHALKMHMHKSIEFTPLTHAAAPPSRSVSILDLSEGHQQLHAAIEAEEKHAGDLTTSSEAVLAAAAAASAAGSTIPALESVTHPVPNENSIGSAPVRTLSAAEKHAEAKERMRMKRLASKQGTRTTGPKESITQSADQPNENLAGTTSAETGTSNQPEQLAENTAESEKPKPRRKRRAAASKLPPVPLFSFDTATAVAAPAAPDSASATTAAGVVADPMLQSVLQLHQQRLQSKQRSAALLDFNIDADDASVAGESVGEQPLANSTDANAASKEGTKPTKRRGKNPSASPEPSNGGNARNPVSAANDMLMAELQGFSNVQMLTFPTTPVTNTTTMILDASSAPPTPLLSSFSPASHPSVSSLGASDSFLLPSSTFGISSATASNIPSFLPTSIPQPRKHVGRKKKVSTTAAESIDDSELAADDQEEKEESSVTNKKSTKKSTDRASKKNRKAAAKDIDHDESSEVHAPSIAASEVIPMDIDPVATPAVLPAIAPAAIEHDPFDITGVFGEENEEEAEEKEQAKEQSTGVIPNFSGPRQRSAKNPKATGRKRKTPAASSGAAAAANSGDAEATAPVDNSSKPKKPRKKRTPTDVSVAVSAAARKGVSVTINANEFVAPSASPTLSLQQIKELKGKTADLLKKNKEVVHRFTLESNFSVDEEEF